MRLRSETMDRVLGYTRRIAVVGLSPEPWRPSYTVASYLAGEGFEIVPVNPFHDEIMGRSCYPSLLAVPGDIDVVDVFRRAEHLPGVARDAVAAGARALWLQSGLRSEQAARIAADAGLDYVEDRCLKVEVARRGLSLPRSPVRAV